MNRILGHTLMIAVILGVAGCATTPPELTPEPEPVTQEPEPDPVILPKPALLDKTPVFAPPPSPAVEAYHNDAHLLPLSEYKRKVKRLKDRRLPYRR